MIEDQPANATRFDLDTFGEDVERAAGVPVTWDDKEVFVILRPQGDTVERIRAFLLNYWA